MARIPWKSFDDYGENIKWVKHYSSNHQILLVGEGDFSFSCSLAVAFGDASNIVATSLDSYDVVIKKYKRAKANLELLYSRGAQLLHGVDAMKMKLHTDLQMRKFDRIVYNFPHAGFFGKESDNRVITMHKNLVCGFFKNASRMLRPCGEVHVSHKTANPFDLWNIEELASQSFLSLFERVKFKIEDYPGYDNKRGEGIRSDSPFPLGECCTFKFILDSKSNKSIGSHHISPQEPQMSSSERVYPNIVMNNAPIVNKNQRYRVFREYFDHALSTNGQADDYIFHAVQHMSRIGFERCSAERHVNPLNDYISHLKELQYICKGRIAYLQNLSLEIDQLYGLLVWVQPFKTQKRSAYHV
ncbi:heavy metal-associated isoprenylated plant protein 41-like protein [Tanacetum coccineum]